MNNNEKMLIEQENKNIFKKAFDFIKKLFGFRKTKNNFDNNLTYKKTSSFTDEFEKNKKLLNIQKNFENGTIKEQDLTTDERSSLVDLYKRQIEDLQRDIESERKLLQSYKEQILRAKANLESKNKKGN